MRRHTNLLNDIQTKAHNRFLARKGTGVMAAFMGARGTGKTQLALAIAQKYNKYIYTTAMRFFLGLADAFDKGERIAFIDRHLEKELIILDEAHLKGETDWNDRVLQFLLDEAYRKRIDTIVIANAPASEFEKLFGESIYRRFDESGGVIDCSKWPVIAKGEKLIIPETPQTQTVSDDWSLLYKHENDTELSEEVKSVLNGVLERLGRSATLRIGKDYLERITK